MKLGWVLAAAIVCLAVGDRARAQEPEPLSVTSISPTSGYPGGGETLTIVGSNFKHGTKVYFVAVVEWQVLNVVVLGAEHIKISTPRSGEPFDTLANEPGSVDVKLVNPDPGGETVVITDGYLYTNLDRECWIICPAKYMRAAQALKTFHEDDQFIGTDIITVERIWNSKIGGASRQDSTFISPHGGWLIPNRNLGYMGTNCEFNYYRDDVALKIMGYLQYYPSLHHPDLEYVVILGNNMDVPASDRLQPFPWDPHPGRPTDYFYSLSDWQNVMPDYAVGRIPGPDQDGWIATGTITAVNAGVSTVEVHDNESPDGYWVDGVAHQLDDCVIHSAGMFFSIDGANSTENVLHLTSVGMTAAARVDDGIIDSNDASSITDTGAFVPGAFDPLPGGRHILEIWGPGAGDEPPHDLHLRRYQILTNDADTITISVAAFTEYEMDGIWYRVYKPSDIGSLKKDDAYKIYHQVAQGFGWACNMKTWIRFQSDTCIHKPPPMRWGYYPGVYSGNLLLYTSGYSAGVSTRILCNAEVEPHGLEFMELEGGWAATGSYIVLDTHRDEIEQYCGDSRPLGGGFGGKAANWWNWWAEGDPDVKWEDRDPERINWFKNVALCGGNLYGNWRYEGEMSILELLDSEDTKTLENPEGDYQNYFAGMRVRKFFHTNTGIAGQKTFEVDHVARLFGSIPGERVNDDAGCGLVYIVTSLGWPHWGWPGRIKCQDDSLWPDTVWNYRSKDTTIPILVTTSDQAMDFEHSPLLRTDLNIGEALVLANDLWNPANLGGCVAMIGFTGETASQYQYRSAESGCATNKGLFRMQRETYESFNTRFTHAVFRQYHQDARLVGHLFVRAIQSVIEERGTAAILDGMYEETALYFFTLLGDPCIYIPKQEAYGGVEESTTPGFAYPASGDPGGPRTGMGIPSYNSYDAPIFQVPRDGTTTCTVTPSGGSTSRYKISVFGARMDQLAKGPEFFDQGESFTITFDDRDGIDPDTGLEVIEGNPGPGTYIVRIEPREDAITYLDPDDERRYMKETRLYIEVVNEFRPQPQHNILVIDDDQSDHMRILFRHWLPRKDYEQYYTGVLDFLIEEEGTAYEFDVWHVDNDDPTNTHTGPPGDDRLKYDENGRHGEITTAMLRQYLSKPTESKAVVYFTGDDGVTTLVGTPESYDQAAVRTFLDEGGNIFVTGQDIGWDLTHQFYSTGYGWGWGESVEFSVLLSTYFCASYVQSDIGLYNIDGVYQDPISDAIFNINIEGGNAANNQNSPSEIAAIPPAVPFLTYDETSGYGNEPTGTAGIHVDTDIYRVVYLGFGFEAIDNIHDCNGRKVLLKSILEWLFKGSTSGVMATITPAEDPYSATGGTPIEFAAQGEGGTGGPYDFTWDFGDDSPTETGATVTHTYAAGGSYTVVLTVRDAGNIPGQVSMVVEVTGLMAGISASPTSGTVPLIVQFRGIGSGGTEPYRYKWDFGDDSPETAYSLNDTEQHTFTGVGKAYTVTLTVKDNTGATAETTETIATSGLQVFAKVQVSGSEAHFSGYVSGGTVPYQFSWAFGDGATSNFQNPVHTYGGGSYTATLGVIDGAGISASDAVAVTIGGGGGGGGCFLATSASGVGY